MGRNLVDIDIHVEHYFYVMGRVFFFFFSNRTAQSNQPATENTSAQVYGQPHFSPCNCQFESQELTWSFSTLHIQLRGEEEKDGVLSSLRGTKRRESQGSQPSLFLLCKMRKNNTRTDLMADERRQPTSQQQNLSSQLPGPNYTAVGSEPLLWSPGCSQAGSHFTEHLNRWERWGSRCCPSPGEKRKVALARRRKP